MKKWELKLVIEDLRESLAAYQRSEPILRAQLEQMRQQKECYTDLYNEVLSKWLSGQRPTVAYRQYYLDRSYTLIAEPSSDMESYVGGEEGYDAIQKCQAAEMALGEQAGPGPHVDREIRIGGEEEATKEEEARLRLTMLSATKENTDGDQENTERPDDDQPGRIDPFQRTYIGNLRTGGSDYPEFDAGCDGIYRHQVGFWSHSDGTKREGAERQAGFVGRDFIRTRTG